MQGLEVGDDATILALGLVLSMSVLGACAGNEADGGGLEGAGVPSPVCPDALPA
jgi:hypothetical protein